MSSSGRGRLQMRNNGTIYIVEDEKDVADLIFRTLSSYGFIAEVFRTGQAVLRAIELKKPDVCLVDLMLPDMDGLDLVRKFEEQANMGVVILTGLGETADRVLGLEVGADDYLVKPFEPRELVARIKSLVRRLQRIKELAAPHESSKAQFENWTYDIDTQNLISDDGEVEQMCSTEAQLLLTFLRAPNRILSREQLLDEYGLNDAQPYDRSIDVRISRLRKKLEKDPKVPQLIKTVYGAGYLFSTKIHWVEN